MEDLLYLGLAVFTFTFVFYGVKCLSISKKLGRYYRPFEYNLLYRKATTFGFYSMVSSVIFLWILREILSR